jgi:hypothetical protein
LIVPGAKIRLPAIHADRFFICFLKIDLLIILGGRGIFFTTDRSLLDLSRLLSTPVKNLERKKYGAL